MRNKISKGLLSIALTFCIIANSFLEPVSATTTIQANSSTKVTIKSFTTKNYNGDCTSVVTSGTSTKRTVIDTGTYSMGTKLYNELGGTSTAKHTINHLVITHSHADHVGGLQKLVELYKSNGNTLTINNLYINTVYLDDIGNPEDNDADEKVRLSQALNNCLASSKITIKNIYYFGYYKQSRYGLSNAGYWNNLIAAYPKVNFIYDNDIREVNIAGSSCTLAILPAMKKFAYDSNHPAEAANNSSLSAVVYDNSTTPLVRSFKAIFPGDIVGYGLYSLINDSKYSEYLKYFSKKANGVNYLSVYYKVSHHGKRSKEFANPMEATSATLQEYFDTFKNNECMFVKDYVQPTYLIGTGWNSTTSSCKSYTNYSSIITNASRNSCYKGAKNTF